ncbi:hypothetical protein ACP275_04G092200 [Erythranthe tilingii]
MFPIWSKKKGSSCKARPEEQGGPEEQGLRILTEISNGNSNVVVIIKVKPIFLFNINQILRSDHRSYNCYLKSCHLCHKPLNLGTEIYMYMGDLGFCSVECRERQIYLDETKEMEISTQKMLASFRRRRNRDGGGRCETAGLLEDYRRRRHPFSSSQKSRVIFS